MVDPRGNRFAAAVTTAVLALVLVTESVWLLGAQALVFAVGAIAGVKASPYRHLYARLVRPRLGPPGQLEDPRPPQFAQAVGFAFAIAGVVGLAAGWPVLFYLAVAAALAAAFLNAAFGLCLGCEFYLAIRRVLSRSTDISTEVSTS